MSVMVKFGFFPIDKGESLSKYVSRSLKVVDESGLNYNFGPMGTALEGSYDECMKVVKKCYEGMADDCRRVYGTIKIDYRADREDGLQQKIESIENRLGKELKK